MHWTQTPEGRKRMSEITKVSSKKRFNPKYNSRGTRIVRPIHAVVVDENPANNYGSLQEMLGAVTRSLEKNQEELRSVEDRFTATNEKFQTVLEKITSIVHAIGGKTS